MIQDCFKTTKDLKDRAVRLGKSKLVAGGGKSAVYRMAIMEYLEKYENQPVKKKVTLR